MSESECTPAPKLDINLDNHPKQNPSFFPQQITNYQFSPRGNKTNKMRQR